MLKKTIFIAFVVLLSIDASAQISWQQVHTPTPNNYSIASTINGDMFAVKGNELLHSNMEGANGTWQLVTTAPSFNVGEIYGSTNTLFIVDIGGRGIFRSLDQGANWQQVNSGITGIDTTNIRGIIPIDNNNVIAIHYGSNVNKIYYSGNNGSSWSATLNMYSQSARCIFEKSGVTYLMTTSTIYASSDKGVSWTNMNVVLPSSGKVVSFADGSLIMAAGNGKFYTSNDIFTWTELTTAGIPLYYPASQFLKSPNSDTLYLSLGDQTTGIYDVYYSANKGLNWNSVSNGLPTNPVFYSSFASQLLISANGYMFAAPKDNGIYKTTTPVTANSVTSVKNVKDNVAFNLYPNPSNGSINISLDPKYRTVEISITDLSGRNILEKTFTNTTQPLMIDTKSLAAGNYILNVVTEVGAASKIFTKEK